MSELFTDDTRQAIEAKVLASLNATQLMNRNTASSPRAVGDAVQGYLESHFADCVPAGLIGEFNAAFARRAMADFALTDKDGNYIIIDCKTHNTGTSFHMPNLTSVERLARLYEDSANYFALLLVAYSQEADKLTFSSCHFVPIEMLDWSCLTIGALGWGQIQIANTDRIVVNHKCTRKEWMLGLCDRLDLFYPREIMKINDRMDYFRRVRAFWQKQ